MKTTLVIGNYNYSSWSLRAWLVARWSGIKFSEHRLPMDTPTFAEEALQWSPTGLVPVLHDAGEIIWDSLAIAEYLAERFVDAALWPADNKARARARSLSAEMHGGFSKLRSRMPMNCRARGRQVEKGVGLSADIARITAAWDDALQRSGGPFLFGPRCITDAMYAPVVFRFATYGVTLPDTLAAYSDRMLALPDMQAWYEQACAEEEVIAAEEVGCEQGR